MKFKEYIIKRHWKLFYYKNVDMLEWLNIVYKYDLFCIFTELISLSIPLFYTSF